MYHGKHRITRTRVIAASTLLAAAGLGIGISMSAAGAGNASTAITGTTTITAQPDTTSPTGSGTACDTTSAYAQTYGPVWADDDFTATISAVSTGTDTWAVTIHSVGTFAGFADPISCDASLSSGSLYGTIRYTVTSDNTPSQENLASSYTSFSDNLNGLVAAFFGDPTLNTQSFGDGTYSYSYQNGNMTEDNSGIYGDVNSNGGAVSGLTAAAASTTSVTLNWDAVTGATGYQYTYTADGVTSAAQTTTATSATITGLTEGTPYTFTVSAEPSATGSTSVSYTIPLPANDKVAVSYVCGLNSKHYEWKVSLTGNYPAKVNLFGVTDGKQSWLYSTSLASGASTNVNTYTAWDLRAYWDANGSTPKPKEVGALSVTRDAPGASKRTAC
jgi:Fibronectin type III domain